MEGHIITSLLSALIGGLAGAAVTTISRHHLDNKRTKANRLNNSYQLISALEAFVIICAEYVEDAYEAIDEAIFQNNTKKINALRGLSLTLPEDIDFSFIDKNLIDNILALPHLIKHDNRLAFEVFKNTSAVEATEVSIELISKRGLEIWQLTASLRRNANLPQAQYEKNFIKILENAQHDL